MLMQIFQLQLARVDLSNGINYQPSGQYKLTYYLTKSEKQKIVVFRVNTLIFMTSLLLRNVKLSFGCVCVRAVSTREVIQDMYRMLALKCVL